jgi:hypothetical protein
MRMGKPTIGAGDVEIILEGQPAILRPSLRAAQTVSRHAGGVVGAMQAVGRFDFDVIVLVVAQGLGKVKTDELSAVAEQVYATGLTDLVPKLTEFLTNIANGGRPSSGAENPPKPPAS